MKMKNIKCIWALIDVNPDGREVMLDIFDTRKELKLWYNNYTPITKFKIVKFVRN